MIKTFFGAHARHNMISQTPFRAGCYEVHAFSKSGTLQSVTTGDVCFSGVLPVFGGGYEQDDPNNVKGPEDRARDAAHLASEAARSGLTYSLAGVQYHKGADVFVVAFDLTDEAASSPAVHYSKAEEQTFMIGHYEVHLYYPSHCPDKTLQEDHLRVIDSDMGLISTEHHEINDTLDENDRLENARREFARMTRRDSLPKAVAFFTGRHGQDSLMSHDELAAEIRKKTGILTPAEIVVNAVRDRLAAPDQPSAGFIFSLMRTISPRYI